MSNKLISIIVTFAVKDYIHACLDSISAQTYPYYETMVVDNSCDTEFSQGIALRYPGIKLYPQKKNISYAEALNLGIRQTQGDFILCLNDDVILDERFIAEAQKGFFINPKIGMVSGKILRWDRKTLDSTGLFLTPWRTTQERGYGFKDKGQFERPGFIFGVNGAAAFYRREMLEDIRKGNDYFDSDFHFFYEDLDLAWQAQRAGWRGYYISSAIAYHLRGGTARKSSGINRAFARRFLNDDLQSDLIKNRYLAIIKNESAFNFLFHLPAIVLYDLFIWSYILLFKPRLIKIFFSNRKYLKDAIKKRNHFSVDKKINSQFHKK